MRPLVTAIALSATVLASLGCESDGTGPSTPLNVTGTTELDASSTSAFVYFSLGTGSVVSVASPTTSSDWDLALRRYEVRLNGGAVGPKGVSGFDLANNVSATPQQVLAFTPENQRSAFEAIDIAQVPAAGSFVTESLTANPLGWLSFGAQGPVANSQAAWKVKRTSGGGYALMRVTGLTLSGSTQQTALLSSVTVEYRYQPAGGTLGAKQTVTLDRSAGLGAIDFSTGIPSPPFGCGWDLRANADFSITANEPCSVGTAPLDASESFDAATRADNALSYGAFLAGLSGAVPFTSSLDDPRGPFLYNLAGDNRLSATYNIYLVKVGSAIYKVQLIGYYSPTGASGHPTIRYARIQ